ncbi:MAG: FAD-dependent oxidoreductase [Deltaproteobacteria bacterium]|nr:FAD-dependent oxidoreductase [Deltaproteobacteria bacterium]
MQSPKIMVLGTGMAGLGASHRLRNEGIKAVLYDKNPYRGGHTASYDFGGFVFDEGPHVSYTRLDRLRNIFAESVNGEFETVTVAVNNYWKGHWIKHPAITNLHGLPPDLLVKVLHDFIERPKDGEESIRNYEDWLIASYGRTYAETFPMQYTRKFHTTTSDNMTTDWLGPRLYQAKLDEVLLGAVTPDTPNIHYVQESRYPKRNGFISFLESLLSESDIALNHRVVKIDPGSREVFFSHGAVERYDHLISSVPLPDLIPLIEGTPKDVLEAAQMLACTKLLLVNVGIDRPDVSTANWTYFYDDDMPFSRICFQRNASVFTVPDGTSSIQCEVYFSKKYKPMDKSPEEYIDSVIDALRRCGLIREDDRILLRNAMPLVYGNVIFDKDRPGALDIVHGYLKNLGIAYCGRYGDWGYLWTDDSFVSGENAAQRVLDRITS